MGAEVDAAHQALQRLAKAVVQVGMVAAKLDKVVGIELDAVAPRHLGRAVRSNALTVLQGADQVARDVLRQQPSGEEPDKGLLDQLLDPALKVQQSIHSGADYTSATAFSHQLMADS